MLETLLAGVNMEEMLYEIREHCCAMNAGRWDYIFSAIKRFSRKSDCVLPDRKQVKHTINQTCIVYSRYDGIYVLQGFLFFKKVVDKCYFN